MILRSYQKKAVEKCCKALKKYKNTLFVSATGSGKTIILSSVVKERLPKGGKALIMAHRDGLTSQNSDKFRQVAPELGISFYNAEFKDWHGQAVFSMVQTLSQEKNLETMPDIDLLVTDEAHHSPSDSYMRVINRAKEKNSNVEIFGVTATPERSDNKGLRKIFSNVADVVTITDLVRAGHLVPPRAMVIDIGTQSMLKNVKKTASDYDQAEVEAIQNTTYNNRQIIDKWMELSSDRPTVCFCSTISHAVDVMNAFQDAGIPAEAIHSGLTLKRRREVLAAYEHGEIPVLSNPLLLTEGWDSQRTSSIMLLRTSSHKSVVIQMVGRGLRKVDQDLYPGVVKRDCLVLDFGISLLTHGNLNSEVSLKDDGKAGDPEEARKKDCPQCQANVPIQTRECPLCGYEFRIELDENGFLDEAQELRLIEIDLINNSPFKWNNLWDMDSILIATGFTAWACVCSKNGEDWYAIGGKGFETKVLGIMNRMGAIASADDWMRENETARNSRKASRWLHDPASPKQMELLGKFGMCQILSKSLAAAYLTFYFNRKKIEKYLGV